MYRSCWFWRDGKRKIESPEVGRRPQKRDSFLLLGAFEGPHIDNPAFLLFLSCLVNNKNGFTDTNPVGESYQSAMGTHQICGGFLTESTHTSVLPINNDGHTK